MKEFLLLFRNLSGNEGYLLKTEDMAKDMPAWQSWIGGIALQGKLVSTQPVEYGGIIVTKTGTGPGPDKSDKNILVSGYLICKADSHEEVQEWARTCPILKYPEGSVEIRPLVPFSIH
ncbi:MAG TPA: YciI family protein [Flavisolibacter sp.]|nr:YciI family protein [Flavisolibacter sp.]